MPFSLLLPEKVLRCVVDALHIKFSNIGRSSYCVEVKPRPWKIPPPLEVDSADLAEQIWLKIAGGWKKGLTSFWWALNEALSDSGHVKNMSAYLLSIFCRSSFFLRRRPCKNENEQTICETWSSLWYEVTLMCRPRLVSFSNPLAPGSDIQIHVSWGTRLHKWTDI